MKQKREHLKTKCCFWGITFMLSLFFAITDSFAVPLSITFQDSSDIGTYTVGNVDSVQLDFDDVTGDYTVTWAAVQDDFFNGNISFWLNLQNMTDHIFPSLSIYRVSLSQSFTGVSSQSMLSYSGTHSGLTEWDIGDKIVTSNTGPGQFGDWTWISALVNDDVQVAYEGINRDSLVSGISIVTAASGVSPIPEPATMLLFGTGLVGLVGSIIRKKKK